VLSLAQFVIAHILASIYGIAFILVGISHFRNPQIFVEIVPPFLPFALFLVYLTGVMEIAGGIGIIYPGSRVITGRLLVLFLIAVFPANLYMWFADVPFNGTLLTTHQHMLRAGIQVVLIIVALYLSGDLARVSQSR
jgi:uncharacterized membrane protein